MPNTPAIAQIAETTSSCVYACTHANTTRRGAQDFSRKHNGLLPRYAATDATPVGILPRCAATDVTPVGILPRCAATDATPVGILPRCAAMDATPVGFLPRCAATDATPVGILPRCAATDATPVGFSLLAHVFVLPSSVASLACPHATLSLPDSRRSQTGF